MKLSIPDMNCGHCKAAVERAVASEDAGSVVTVDLTAHEAVVDTNADAARLIAALGAAGFPASVIG